MGDIVYFTASSLDGRLADVDHSLDWLMEVPTAAEATEDAATFFADVGAFVMGASTYRWVLTHDGADTWAETYGDRPCFVVTHGDVELVPGAVITVVSGPVAEWIDEARAAAGERDLWLVGGGDLVGQFDDIGGLDRIVVSFAPVTLADGAPLLPRRIESDRLSLTHVRQVGQFAELRYDVRPRQSDDRVAQSSARSRATRGATSAP